MSEVKVNKVSPRSGTGVQLGDSGDTITIPSGATLANSGTMTGVPAPTSGVAASAIDSGTMATARLGSGTANSSTFLRGDQSWAEAGGGAWIALTTTSISGTAASVEFNSTYITATYRDYMIYISDFHLTADGLPYMTISSDNGSSYKSATNYRFATRSWKSDGTNNSRQGTEVQFEISADQVQGNESEEKSSFAIQIYDPLSTSSYFSYSINGFFASGSGLACGMYGGGMYTTDVSDAINAVKISLNSGNFNAGKFTLYGRAV